MSTAARKERKRRGEKLTPKPVKVGTPLEQRSEFNRVVPGAIGTRYAGKLVPVSAMRLQRAQRDRGHEVTP